MAGLHTMRSEQVSPMLFFDQLSHLFAYGKGQDQIFKLLTRDCLEDRVLPDLGAGGGGARYSRRRNRDGVQKALEPVGKYVMALISLVSDSSLNRGAQSCLIAGDASANNRQK
jgi:hypothetical protein